MGLTAPRPERDLDTACDPEHAAEVFAALASPWRLEIVCLLAAGPHEVTGIANCRAHIRPASYAPRAAPGLRGVGPVVETVGRLVPQWGAFQILTVSNDGAQ